MGAEQIAIKSAPALRWWYRLWGVAEGLSLRVYHGYGDSDSMLVFGHVLQRAPLARDRYAKGFWKNTADLLRLFMVKPLPGVPVRLHFDGACLDGTADDTGFFSFRWEKDRRLPAGWHEVSVEVPEVKQPDAVSTGKLYHPHPTKQAFVSDIDDTFLVSYSADLFQRLRVLLTRNPRTRKPFEGVVAHYQALAAAHTTPDAPNPFFYVSSSEWNLYGYIKEFCRCYGLPEGVFLLSPLKRLASFWKTGQGKHHTKYDRIANLLELYESTQFVLLGDDTQEDPGIYADLVARYPGRINAVYLRQRKEKTSGTVKAQAAIQRIESAGVPVCYFRHSQDALAHSRRLGLAE